MKRPSDMPQQGKVYDYIIFLEKQIDGMKEDPIQKIYLSVKEPVEKLATSIMELDINIKADKDDKVFDRFMKYMVEARTIADNIEHLQSKVNPEAIKKIQEERRRANVGYAEKIALGIK